MNKLFVIIQLISIIQIICGNEIQKNTFLESIEDIDNVFLKNSRRPANRINLSVPGILISCYTIDILIINQKLRYKMVWSR